MRRALAILLPLVLAAAAIAHYTTDKKRREPAETFITTFTIDTRRPAVADTARNTQTFDAMNDELAIAAVEDSLGVVNFNSLDDQERRRWIEAVAKFDEELLAARALALDALAARPGWPAHHAALGQVAYVAQQRRLDDEPDHAKWFVPLRHATNGAPGNDAFATFLGGALLEQHASLPKEAQKELAPRLSRAFESPSFVTRAFLPSATVLGEKTALQLIPDRAASIEAALGTAQRNHVVNLAQQLFPRWETAEKSERAADLAHLEERAQRNDRDRLRREVPQWLRSHPPAEFGDAGSIAQLARVLDLSPSGVGGTWPTDPRAEALRILLLDPMPAKTGEERGRIAFDTASTLENLPEPQLARAAVAAGDFATADALLRNSPSAGSFEWTGVLTAIAVAKLAQGRVEEAVSAYELIAAPARRECDVLLLRRDLARAGAREAGNAEEIDAMLEASVAGGRMGGEYGAQWWSRSNRLSLCLDPQRLASRRLRLTIETAEPALVDYGWDDVRLGTASVQPGRTAVLLPLATRAGRHSVYVRSRIPGVAITPSAAVVGIEN